MTKIEDFLFNHFMHREWRWSVKGKGKVLPTQSDFTAVLDKAVETLYSGDYPDGSILEVGRLVLIKQASGLEVYVQVGIYDANVKPIGE